MKFKLIFLTILILNLLSCNKDETIKVEYNEPTGRRLRDIMAEKFPENNIIIGTTAGVWVFSYDIDILINKEFNYITPENEFKQKIIHPNNNTWNFDGANTWIENAKRNEQIIRMHCPIGPQVSDWTKDDQRSANELEQNMNDFLIAVCTTYNKIENIKYMDVVNETVKNGEWFGHLKGIAEWENPWDLLGFQSDKYNTPKYIKKAFQICNQYAPNIKQLYNHHEEPGNIKSWNLIKETIITLKSEGIRIDALGWQAHVDNGWANDKNLDQLRELIDWTHQNSMEFHITEASSFIRNKLSTTELILQAETYSKIIAVLLEKLPGGNIGWNTWHITDAYSYRKELFPAIFDDQLSPKPAYYAIQNQLELYNPNDQK